VGGEVKKWGDFWQWKALSKGTKRKNGVKWWLGQASDCGSTFELRPEYEEEPGKPGSRKGPCR
jgi:hypothetical protein